MIFNLIADMLVILIAKAEKYGQVMCVFFLENTKRFLRFIPLNRKRIFYTPPRRLSALLHHRNLAHHTSSVVCI
jgi:hypothetical protein